MDWITERIAIGNIEDAMDVQALRAAGITGVLCLNGFPQEARWHGLAWVGITLIDGHGNSIDDFTAAVQALRDLHEEHRVMVHCMEGLSRSALVVACYLAEERAITLDEAIDEVTRRRTRASIDHGLRSLVAGGWPIPRDDEQDDDAVAGRPGAEGEIA